MKIVFSIFVRRPPETVWAFLANPENMLLWNSNVTHVSPSSFTDIKQGYRYTITYHLHGNSNATQFQAEIVHFEPPSKLVTRHTEGQASPNRDRIIEETYELSERNGGTFLTQTMQIENSGVNIFMRLLIRAIRKFGKPAGTTHLAPLREIIERDEQNI